MNNGAMGSSTEIKTALDPEAAFKVLSEHPKRKLRVAILHDWLVTWRGGEKCLEAIAELFEDVEVFTLFAKKSLIETRLPRLKVSTGALGKIPGVSSCYRLLLLLYPFDTFFLSKLLCKSHKNKPYDMIISISHCAVKNIRPPKGLPHICYCLTPMRYIWDQYDRYFDGRWYEIFFRIPRKLLQAWDRYGARNVSTFIGISNFISRRIFTVYDRESYVVYPPVTINTQEERAQHYSGDPYFLVVNALVPYKNTKIIVEAFQGLPYKLKIVGVGPEEQRLKSMASRNVEFCGLVDDCTLQRLYEGSEALIFAAEEDFGIVPVEAQGYGTPVICYGRGGCLETVTVEGEKLTGIKFDILEVEEVSRAVIRFLDLKRSQPDLFLASNCRENAKRFTKDVFVQKFLETIDDYLSKAGSNQSDIKSVKLKIGGS